MSHRARGNSDRALFDRLRLLSLQNLKKRGEKEKYSARVCEREGGKGKRNRARQRETKIFISVL